MTVAKKLEGCNSLRPCRWSRQARPSRVGQRSQRTATLPRHVAMAPSPSYLPASCRDIMCWQLATVATSSTIPRTGTTARAHPSCDRLRGSLRSGDMSLLPTTHCPLPTTLYQLSSTFLHFYTAIFTTARAPSLQGRRRYGGRRRVRTLCPLPTANYHLPTNLNAIVNRKFRTGHRLAENGQV